ncbi:hypothetical protein AB0M92_08415 [Streptomyces sp. NPDC051582]|uniref:hypothetical protein n=1 Tax=Streptomyces sp. NPDC051582 TaxID=3155167 RepID=UPI003420005A
MYGFDGKLIEKYVAERSVGASKAGKPAADRVERPDRVGGVERVERVERVVPKGGVKAGAEGADAGSAASKGDSPVLVAAGGGMAAVGAAGLGFALLTRGGADQS